MPIEIFILTLYILSGYGTDINSASFLSRILL
jgi:hypothetical protein